MSSSIGRFHFSTKEVALAVFEDWRLRHGDQEVPWYVDEVIVLLKAMKPEMFEALVETYGWRGHFNILVEWEDWDQAGSTYGKRGKMINVTAVFVVDSIHEVARKAA